jgi:hypothetical protein
MKPLSMVSSKILSFAAIEEGQKAHLPPFPPYPISLLSNNVLISHHLNLGSSRGIFVRGGAA